MQTNECCQKRVAERHFDDISWLFAMLHNLKFFIYIFSERKRKKPPPTFGTCLVIVGTVVEESPSNRKKKEGKRPTRSLCQITSFLSFQMPPTSRRPRIAVLAILLTQAKKGQKKEQKSQVFPSFHFSFSCFIPHKANRQESPSL